MVLHLLIIENEERRCLMVERPLDDPEDVIHFDDKTLIKVITDFHAIGTGTSFTETNKSVREHYQL